MLTAIADELQRDEAEERRGAQEQGKAEKRGIPEERGTAQRPVAALDEAAAQAEGETPAEAVAQGEPVMAAGAEAHPGEPVARAGDVLTSAGGEAGQADLQAPAPDQMDQQAAASTSTAWSPGPGQPDSQPQVLDQAAAPAPTVWSPPPRPADLLPPAPGLEAHQPAASAPTVWSPPPRPADLPPPAPDRAAHRASPPDQADLQAPAADRPDPQPAVPLPRRNPGRNGAPPAPAHVRRQFLPSSLLGRRLGSDDYIQPVPTITGFRAGSPAAPEAGYRADDPAAAATLPTGAPPLMPRPSGSAPPGPGEAGAAPPAGVPPVPAVPPDLAGESPPPAAGATTAASAAPGPAGPASAAAPAPAAPSAARTAQGSGRRYRIAGLLVAVIALLVAAAIAFLLSGRHATAGNGQGLGAPGAGAGERNLAAAWVAGQVSRTAVVACDPVMCHALAARGVPVRVLYPLGPATASPLHSQIIVATAQLRARFGSLLSSVYAPAVLASFGSGPQRIEIRQTAPHGAAAYRATLGDDLLSRRASGAELLRSNRITVAPIARQQLSAGQVDSRLLIAIAEMAAMHPLYIINFGSEAPGADSDLPLRFADLAETRRAHHHFGPSAGYVRSLVSFLQGQRIPFRPTHVATVHLARGTKALRIEFPAPSPLGLLPRTGPDRA